jgi:hypothetical protein
MAREDTMADTTTVRDTYVEAFNRGDLGAIEALLHEDAVYRWVMASRAERGREAVMKLYRMGHDAYGGRSRLSAVPGTSDQAIWWEPRDTGLAAAGLQTIQVDDGAIRAISDEHSPAKVQAAAEGLTPPE